MMPPPDDCAAPPPLTDEALLAALSGEGAEAVRAHLERCAACHARAARLAALDRLLGELDRVDCPSPETLTALALDEVGWRERRRLAAHVARCPDCADELETSQQFLAVEDAPKAALGRRISQIVFWRSLATLPPAAAWRETPGGGPRRYTAAPYTLTLSVAAVGRRERLLRGRLSPPPPAEALPEARFGQEGADTPVVTVALDNTGTFRAGPLAPGYYTLELLVGDVLYVLENIEV
ncbi:MAG: zf-HC2 domain-containing protein [Ardenticatenaceae bacterium]|nr:zf-HC2 domain-containing protein [Ardenticatenaceae bacterium]